MSDLWVEYDSKRVGRAAVDDETVRFSFAYEESWLQRSDAFPISANLPLRAEPWPARRAHPFFANLLPEGAAREAICDRLGVSSDNDVALLEALGDDTAGALRFIPVDGVDDRRGRERQHIEQSELEQWAQGAPAFSVDPDRPPRLSLAGAQHKASVILTDSGYALPGSGEASTHILKFDSSRFPHLTANEFLVTRFAAELGIEVVESHLDDRTTPPLLVVERYDRHSNGSATRRVHQEDFCQILGLLPAQKYEKEGGPTLARIATALRSVSARPALDILRLVRWVILCALCGNADGHAKNLSVLYGASGPTLAPAYDLVCTRAFPNLHRELAFAIGGEHNSDRILRENWEIFAEDIGVRPRRVISEVAQMVADAPEAFERAVEQLREQIGASHAVQHVSPAVHKRIRALQTHL